MIVESSAASEANDESAATWRSYPVAPASGFQEHVTVTGKPDAPSAGPVRCGAWELCSSVVNLQTADQLLTPAWFEALTRQ